MSAHEIHHLLHGYGIAIVFSVVALQAVGVPLPGTTVLIAAALYAAASHGLPIAAVIAAGAVGALVGSTAGYALGRWGGETLLLRIGRALRQGPDRVQALRGEFATQGALWVFIGRFVSGLRNVTGLIAGASGMPARRFVSVAGLSALIWALFNGLGYYWFGHALQSLSTWLQVVLVCLGIVWLGFSLRLLRRRALKRLEGTSLSGSA